jgi:Fe2+ transport system protein FeoA
MARILSLKHPESLAHRLMEMGLLEGEEVQLVRLAPLGDPVELRVGSTRLSIRLSEAKLVEVGPCLPR